MDSTALHGCMTIHKWAFTKMVHFSMESHGILVCANLYNYSEEGRKRIPGNSASLLLLRMGQGD